MSYEVVCSSTDRDAWLAERRKGIGSSDAAAVIGVSPFASALSVYTDKLGLLEDRERTEAMEWGSILEPVIIRRFSEETRRECKPQSVLIRSTERPWQLATLDALQLDAARGSGVLECKATGYRGDDWDDGVPEHVFCQVQHQLAVTGFDWGSAAVLIGGARFRWKDVPRDDAFITKLNNAEEALWDRVLREMPPDPDGSDSAKAALKALYPESTGHTITLPGDFVDLDEEYERLGKEIASREKFRETLKQKIKLEIGDATIGVLPNGVTYTHATQHREAYSVDAMSYRVLRRSAPKKGYKA